MNEVDRDKEVLEELLFNLVIYADKKSSSMAEVCATKWIVYPSSYRCRLPSPTLPVAVLGGFFWFLRTTPFRNSKFFFCCSLALETGSDSE